MPVIDLAQLSLSGSPNPIAEAKHVLWWADGTTASTTNTSANMPFLQDGSTTAYATTTPSPYSMVQIFSLSATSIASTKFALECTIWSASATTGAVLYDITSSTQVASISTTSTTATVVRSGQVTLTPGHKYGVYFYSSSTTVNAYLSDASLIVFP